MAVRKLKPKQWRTKADALWSQLIRSAGKCARCGKTDNIQASHVISRSYAATRTDLSNGIPLCSGCHIFWWHKHPIEAGRWFDQAYPGLYDRLKSKAEQVTKVNWAEEYQRLLTIANAFDKIDE